MFTATLAAALLQSVLTGKGVVKGDSEVIQEMKQLLELVKDKIFNVATTLN